MTAKREENKREDKAEARTEHKERPEDARPRRGFNPVLLLILLLLVVGGSIVGVRYWNLTKSRVYIEKAEINAPIITLSPQASGVLERLFVREGDAVRKNMVVAQVNGQPILAKTDGVIVSVQNTPGQIVTPQTAVAKMIDPTEFRLVGRVDEDKGLTDIRPGQHVIFTVDAFGEQQFEAIVEQISPASRDSDLVFSISDKREERQFNVKARYDLSAYPQLRSGMSARMWVYK